MSSNKSNNPNGYRNNHGAHQDNSWKSTAVWDVTQPEHNGSRMSNENYDRMQHTPSNNE